MNAAAGTVDRRIFSDLAIYHLELERIFARAWHFMCHDSQIPNSGDFFMSYIGEDRVICVRDNEGNPQTLINSCRHRGNAVCRAEEGHTTSFMCTYHGWTYDLQGELVGVPGFKEVYHEELDRENWGLISAGKVDSFMGFIFATMDAEAPGLEEFLGEVGCLGLGRLAGKGAVTVAGGIQKYRIACNWKFPADNAFDWYHAPLTHASASLTGYGARRDRQANVAESSANGLLGKHLVLLGEYGHAASGPRSRKRSRTLRPPGSAASDSAYRYEEVLQALGRDGVAFSGHWHLFPNTWLTNGQQISVRHPRGPNETEIWWFTFLNSNEEDQTLSAKRHRAVHTFGPAGMFEQEDGDNWAGSTASASGQAGEGFPLNLMMGLGRGVIVAEGADLPRIETAVNEHAQLWFYKAWSEWANAGSWAELKANLQRPAGTV